LLSYFPERDDPATVIPISVPASSPILTPNTADVWFSGIPFALGSNPMLVPILHAPSEAFAAEIDSGQDALVDAADKGGEGLWAGRQLGVVVGFQALGNARITWVGGPEVFGDNFAVKEVAK
jgi:oligosaccharyltransferase complex subunit beta